MVDELAKPAPGVVQSQPVQSPMVTGQGKKMCGWELDEGLPMIEKWEFLVRLQGKQKDKAKQYVADRDGKECCFCGIEEQNLDALTIHHRDGIESHNHRSNLRLAHLGHNTSWYHRKKGLQVQSSVPIVREREGESALPKPGLAAAAGGAFDFRPGMSRSEMALEMRAEWDHWVDGIVLGVRDMDRSPLRGGRVLMLRDLAQMAHHALHCEGSWKCYSSDTYVLTELGWKLHSEWNGERIVVYDPHTATLRLELPEAYVCQDYVGPMIHITANCIDLLVTPNHRMFVCLSKTKLPKTSARQASKSKRNYLLRMETDTERRYWSVVEASELLKHRRWEMYVTAKWEGELKEDLILPMNLSGGAHAQQQLVRLSLPVLVSLIGYYVTEGSHSNHKAIRISQARDSPVCAKIENVLNQLPYRWSNYLNIRAPSPASKHVTYENNYRIFSKPLCDWISKNCGGGAYEKHLPQMYKNLPSPLLELLFHAMMDGDGSWNRTGTSGYFVSVSKQLALDFMELSTKIGYAAYVDETASLTPSRKPIKLYRVYIAYRATRVFDKTCRTNRIEVIPYSGKISCFKTSTGFYLTMRNGRATIQGNTYYDYAMEDRFGGCLVVWKSTGKQWVAHRDFYELVTINGVKIGTFHGEEDLTVIPKQVPIERAKEERAPGSM